MNAWKFGPLAWLCLSSFSTATLAGVLDEGWFGASSPEQRSLAPSQLIEQTGGQRLTPELDAPAAHRLLDLNQAVQMAVNRHPSIADAIATLAQQGDGIAMARSGYYPQVKMGLGRGDITQNGTSQTASLSVSQLLYDFGKVAGSVDSAQAQSRRQQALVLKQIDLISRQTAEATIDLHRYRLLGRIADEQVSAMERVYAMTQDRAGAGVTSRSDPIQALARVDAARANQLQIRSQYHQAQERLRTLVGGPVSGEIAALSDDQAARVDLARRLDTSILPDVLAAEAERQTAEAQLRVAKADRMPTVSIEAASTKALSGDNPSTYERHGSDNSISLNFTSTLYQGGGLRAQVRAATNALEAARQRIEDARLSASDQMRNMREQIIGNRARLGVLGSRKRNLDESRELYREQYKLGTRSILDLLNTEQEYYQALSDEEMVRHDLWLGQVGLVDAQGRGREFYGLNYTTVQGMEVLP
ncbi:TolC family outer membrane protein [Pseudomonas nitroreducens]|uniref:TolC family outer membrane protein n=1 Tax=Pseudomonas nitroreducens TaxID=46680 RepID=UPI003CC81E8F